MYEFENKLFFDVSAYNFFVSHPIFFKLKTKIGMVKLRGLTKLNIDITAAHQRPVQVQHSILDATTLSALSTEEGGAHFNYVM